MPRDGKSQRIVPVRHRFYISIDLDKNHWNPICSSLAQEYEDKAVQLGVDDGMRESLRSRLMAARLSCPLFDTRRWVGDLERALELMWKDHCSRRWRAESSSHDETTARGETVPLPTGYYYDQDKLHRVIDVPEA